MPKKVTPQKQLMLEFRNREEQYVISTSLAPFNREVQEDLSLALVAYIRFGVKRDTFPVPFIQGVFDNLVSYLDFTRGREVAMPLDEFPSPVMYAMAAWYDEHPDDTAMFTDNSQHIHTYADLAACFPELKEAIRKDGHKLTDKVKRD